MFLFEQCFYYIYLGLLQGGREVGQSVTKFRQNGVTDSIKTFFQFFLEKQILFYLGSEGIPKENLLEIKRQNSDSSASSQYVKHPVPVDPSTPPEQTKKSNNNSWIAPPSKHCVDLYVDLKISKPFFFSTKIFKKYTCLLLPNGL